MVICVLPAIQWFKMIPTHQSEQVTYENDDEDETRVRGHTDVRGGNFLARTEAKRIDPIQEMYQNQENQSHVIEFFAELCNSKSIATIILANANEFDIPPALAFSLCWEESRFNPRAFNNANRDNSVDRGLFQLNNRTFPNLGVQDFYNPEINAHNGMKYLRTCLDNGNTEIIALSMYNAGAGRVSGSGTPLRTLVYVSRILENSARIESHFISWEVRRQQLLLEGIDIEAEAFFEDEEEEEDDRRIRLLPLFPLGIR
jgi:SLT domain-containing protein